MHPFGWYSKAVEGPATTPVARGVGTHERRTAMATDTQATAPALKLYRLTVPQFEAMIGADVFGDDRVELLGGVLVMMTRYQPHDSASEELGDALERFLDPRDWYVREEKPVRFGRSWRPEPDVAVVRGPRMGYKDTPRAADIALLIEVADTTYAKDRGVKWRRYAAAGIPAYWIADLTKRRVEVFTGPTGAGKSALYQNAVEYGEDAEVPVIIDGREFGRIAVRSLFP